MCPINDSPDRSDVVERSYVAGAVSVGTSAVEAKVGASRVATRQIAYIRNTSNLHSIWWGPSGVTSSGASMGVELLPGQFVSLPFGDVGIYLISTQAGGVTAIVGEVG